MCGLAGFYILNQKSLVEVDYSLLAKEMHSVFVNTSERGRDSFGLYLRGKKGVFIHKVDSVYDMNYEKLNKIFNEIKPFVCITNFRGEPSTEVIEHKTADAIQPLQFFKNVVAHNGTISNDKQILHGSDIVSVLRSRGYKGHVLDSYAFLELMSKYGHRYNKIFDMIEGSYAVSMLFPDNTLILGRNYRDLAIRTIPNISEKGIMWASKPYYLESVFGEQPFNSLESIEPYSYYVINDRMTKGELIRDPVSSEKAIVVISGGMDSTVAATKACMENTDVTLLHIKYGCKAEQKEVEAINNIHEYLTKKFPHVNITKEFFETDLFRKLGGSTITDPELYSEIATGDKAVETHNEWVPARNLVLISIAASYCDRYNIGRIYLGLNMEEGSSYPDNTTEFYERLNDVLTTGTTARPIIINPLANLMKHEIVKYGMEIGAPLDLSWSCYHSYEKHCGECGSCTMKKVSYKRYGIPFDTIKGIL